MSDQPTVGVGRPAAGAGRRGEAVVGVIAGLAVMAVLIGAFFAFRADGGEETAAPTVGATAAPTAGPTAPAVDLDPALGTKPAAGAGSGEVTELSVTPIIQGGGPAVRAGQEVAVNYVGVYHATGEEFDASWNRGEPFTFQLGAGSVIPGWDQGLVGVTVGSRVQLDIPAALAYGDPPRAGYPEGALRFIVDVLAVR